MKKAFSLKFCILLAIVFALLISGGALWAGSKPSHDKKATTVQPDKKKCPADPQVKIKEYLLKRFPTQIVSTGPDEMYSGHALGADPLSEREHYTMPMILEAHPIEETPIPPRKK